MSAAARFDFEPFRGALVLARMRRAPDGPVTIAGDDFAHAAMGALLSAELLAAEAGVVPWLTLPDGGKGLAVLGAARERIDEAPEDVRTIYLATHALVRRTHAEARPPAGTAPKLEGLAPLLGSPLFLLSLTVVALAAVVGTAWYFTRQSAIEVDGRNVRTTALAAEIAHLAHEQLRTTGQIDPGVWEALRAIAEIERAANWTPLAWTGLALGTGVGGFYLWKRHKELKGTFR